MSSDISIKEASIPLKPDVFIGIQKEKGIIFPIAIFEIKLYQTKRSIESLIKRFAEIRSIIKNNFPEMKDSDLPYFIWLYLRYQKYSNQKFEGNIKKFQEIDNNFAVINHITEWNEKSYESFITPKDGGINVILNKVVQRINNFI